MEWRQRCIIHLIPDSILRTGLVAKFAVHHVHHGRGPQRSLLRVPAIIAKSSQTMVTGAAACRQ